MEQHFGELIAPLSQFERSLYFSLNRARFVDLQSKHDMHFFNIMARELLKLRLIDNPSDDRVRAELIAVNATCNQSETAYSMLKGALRAELDDRVNQRHILGYNYFDLNIVKHRFQSHYKRYMEAMLNINMPGVTGAVKVPEVERVTKLQYLQCEACFHCYRAANAETTKQAQARISKTFNDAYKHLGGDGTFNTFNIVVGIFRVTDHHPRQFYERMVDDLMNEHRAAQEDAMRKLQASV